MNIKRIAIVLAVIFATSAIMLSACGGGGSSSGKKTSKESINEGKEIAQKALDYSSQTQTEIKDDAKSSKDTLTFAAVADPGKISLDSLFDMTQYPFATACVEYFIRWDFKEGKFYSPVSTYEPDKDNLGVTFHITPGIKMHDGETFKASDLVASIEAQRKHSGLGWQLDFVDLKNSKIIDDYTIDIRFNKVNGVWESSFSMFTVISGKAYNAMNGDEKFYQAPVSPAPYRVTEWVSGDHITITAFDDYYRGAPPIKTMTMKIVSDETTAFMELQKGQIDLLWNLSADQVKTVYAAGDKDDLELLLTDSNIINYVGMNSANKALSDFRVRQAIYLAVNRDEILLGSFDGLAYPINSIMTNESIGYNTDYDTNSPFPKQDIEKAKELMKEAGYGDGLELRILAESTINFQLVTEQLAAMLKEIGITLKPELTDYATQNAKLHSDDVSGYDLYLSFSQACDESVATLDNPMLYGMSHPELSADKSGDGLQAIWNEIRVTPDITKRAALYGDAQKYFFEKGLYWLPLNETQNYVGVNKNLTGFRFNGSLIYFEDVYYK